MFFGSQPASSCGFVPKKIQGHNFLVVVLMRTIIFINHVFSTIIFWGTLFVDKHKDQNLGRFKMIFTGYSQDILDIGNE